MPTFVRSRNSVYSVFLLNNIKHYFEKAYDINKSLKKTNIKCF